MRLEQREKAEFSIEVTESGMVMLVRLEQSLKAEFPMEVTEAGILKILAEYPRY